MMPAVAPVLLRIVRESARVRRDRRGHSTLPRDIGDVDAAALSRLLDRDVRAVEAVGRNSGTTTRARLRVTSDDGTLPATLFMKIAPTETRTRLFVNLMGLGRQEVAFYRDLRGDVPVETPKVYAARYDTVLARFALVLEDLEARGCRFGDITRPVGADEAAAVVAALARLHAAFWNSPRFATDLAWIRGQQDDPNAALVARLIKRSVAQVERSHGDRMTGAVRAGSRQVVACRTELDARLGRGPRTLQHGDTHVGNMAFDGATPVFFDWQVVRRGPGLRDVAYFIVTSLAVEARRNLEKDLLREYQRELHAGGIDSTFEDLWYRYRLHAVDPWIASVVTVAAGGLQAAHIADVGLERSLAAVQDLDTFAEVREFLDH
jgi:aminoglycoside phosphotransferase (APT) family kinase protein